MGIRISHKLIVNLTPEEYDTYSRCNMRRNGDMMGTVMDHRRWKHTGYAIRAIDDEGYLVGCGVLDRSSFMLYVRPRYRRHGIGSRIVARAARVAREKGWEPKFFPWDERSTAFYDKNKLEAQRLVAV